MQKTAKGLLKLQTPTITPAGASVSLVFINKTENRCNCSGFCSFIIKNYYIYQYKHDLGNARVSFAKDGAGALEVTDTNNYYPFGLNHISNSFSTSGFGGYYSYKYNGKELQETDMFDYEARMYMPDLGRWGVIDPLAEASRRFTPYHYGNNNPIRFIDPDGRLTVDNLQGGYSTGSAVADFMFRTGLSSDERNMPLFYRNEGGAMIRTEALGNEGQGGGGAAKGPKSSFWKDAGIFLRRLFRGNKGAGISMFAPGATISRIPIVEVGELTKIPEFFSAVEVASIAVGAATLGAILTPTMMKDPEYNWTRDLPWNVPVTGTTDVPADESSNLYLYRNMRSVNGMPMVGEGLDKLGLRDRDVNLLSNSTMITPLFANGLSVTVGYGDVIPPNVPDFSRGKGKIFRIQASSLMSYGLVGLPVLNPDVPNYGQIRPAIPMNVGTFRALIQSTAPAWQPVK